MEGAGVWDYFPSIVSRGCATMPTVIRGGVATICGGDGGSVHEGLLVEWTSEDGPASPG